MSFQSIYLTNAPDLSPIQAQIQLGLKANSPLRDVIIEVDVTGYKPFRVGPVQGNLPYHGPGGGG